MDEKIRFALIGAGWRARYYLRAARKVSSNFEVCAVLCRSPEKADALHAEYNVRTVLTPQEVIAEHPDFVVVAVTKTDIAAVSREWIDCGFAVFAETPAAMDRNTVRELIALERSGAKLVSAEQYRYYPEHSARLKLVRSGLFGTPQNLYLSAAHEYHGLSLMRAYLQIEAGTPFTVTAAQWTYPVTETMSRYERIQDGRLADRIRTGALFTFDDGKSCIYDFDSDQYRSLIRGSHLRLSGSKGEIMDRNLSWIDETNAARHAVLQTDIRSVPTGDDNPNFSTINETVSVLFENRVLYEPEFGLCGLSEDEAAILQMLGKMKAYSAGNGETPYPLREAIWDSYSAILLREAAASGTALRSVSYDELGSAE